MSLKGNIKLKAKRQDKILEIVLSKSICTQEELLEELKKENFLVTQATVSRDIKELKLVKEMDAKGSYRYVTSAKKKMDLVTSKFGAIFNESVINVDYVKNMVVIKCHSGMANAACATLDSIDLCGIAGTIAGDDTIFVLMRTDEYATKFTKEIYKAISQ